MIIELKGLYDWVMNYFLVKIYYFVCKIDMNVNIRFFVVCLIFFVEYMCLNCVV